MFIALHFEGLVKAVYCLSLDGADMHVGSTDMIHMR